jgi:hypothetical protein
MKKALALVAVVALMGGLASCGPTSNSSTKVSDSTVATSSQPASAISISIVGNNQVEVGAAVQLTITLKNDTQRLGYTVVSSDTTVATVDNTGRVTGIKVGTTTITATAEADKTVTMDVTMNVIASSMPTLSLTGSASSVVYGNGASVTLTADLVNPTSSPATYKWSSRNSMGYFSSYVAATTEYTPAAPGSDIVDLEVKIGAYVLNASYSILALDNYNSGEWTAIGTKADFLDKVRTSGTNTGKFYLTADIDMGGDIFDKADGTIISGVFDGRGHTISNFTLGADYCGFFYAVPGRVCNLGISGAINKGGSKWGNAMVAREIGGSVSNVLVTVDHTYDTGLDADATGYVPFVAGVAGVAKENGRFNDIVVNVADTVGKATIYADTAYPAGGPSAINAGAAKTQSFSFKNFYTNSNVAGGQPWDWGSTVLDQSGYTKGIDWANCKASTYALNPALWNLADNAMPTLKAI